MSGTPLAHPARGVLAQRRITISATARQLGVSEQYLSRALLGHVSPSARIRQGLSELLGLPETELFFPTEPVPRYPGDLLIEAAG
jgi:transcriptional regulator with XRE-family HTH domain